MRLRIFLLLLVASLMAVRAGQDTGSNNVVFTVSQTLIQVDAEVTDRKGHPVRDLRADEFEVLLAHEPQQITNVSYIPLDSPDANKPAIGGRNRSALVNPKDVHRSMVLLVDDLGLSFESMAYTKRTLHEFVQQNMHAGDLFALWQTGHFNSVFQQFTSDKRVLEAAIDNLKWNPNSTGLLQDFKEQDRQNGGFGNATGPRTPGFGAGGFDTPGGDAQSADEQLYLKSSLAASVFATMNELVEELRPVGGRKAIVLFSDGIDIAGVPNVNAVLNPGIPEQEAVLRQERELIDNANRSGAVLYAIDMRGLEYRRPRAIAALYASQAGLQELTEATGGFAVVNSNGFAEALNEIKEDQSGYYLIAFKAPPDIETTRANNPRFLPLQIRVKRRGLEVRSRKGFWGETDEAAQRQLSGDEQMRASLRSLFNQSDLDVRLSASYVSTANGAAAVRNLFYVDANSLSFADGGDGKHTAVLSVIVTASFAGSRPLANLSKRVQVEADDEQLARLRRDGVLLQLELPIPKPGAYQVRVSAQDDTSKRIGSAGQYLDIPNLKKLHIALTTPLLDTAATPARERYRGLSAALRTFQAGTDVAFVSVVQTDSPSLGGAMDGTVELYRGDELILSSAIPVVPVQGQKAHALSGRLKLKESLPPGQYYFKARVTEHAGTHSRDAVAWTDFEVLAPTNEAAAID